MDMMNKGSQNPKKECFELPLMPLREVVMFPHSIVPLFVGREASIKAIENAVTGYDRKICLVVQREPEVEKPSLESLYEIGVVSRILQFLRLPDGTIKVLFEGLYRVYWEHIDINLFDKTSFAKVMVKPAKEPPISLLESEALVRATHEALEEYAKNNKKITQEALAAISGLREPGRLADSVMPHLKVDYTQKQAVLELLDPFARLEKVFELLSGEITVNTIERRIKSRVKTQMERNQREYYLNEQIKAIQKEMGREDDPQADLADLEKRFLERDMPEEAREKALGEIKKLKHMSPSAAEYAVVRNYVDWIFELPWNKTQETFIDIPHAQQVLDAEHFGLEKPKQRILEYLAVQKLTGSCRGSILCLVGPPGVGKTSLARSVAKATGREYVRLSLGGVRDEAEIRGHRRTYVGAMPGKLITALRKAKYNNPLLCLDEIDKMSADFRGDPAAALLEVLDPEQNSTFNDHYLDLDYDLSKVFFITTANSLQGIPMPLQDRMEVIELSSYLEVEKKHIAKGFLLPRQLEKHGLQKENIRLSENALTEIIRSYTKEAGVRNLDREIAAVCRKIAIRLVESDDMHKTVSVTRQNLEGFLGVKKYRINESEKVPKVGVVNGLAYTGMGGVLLNVEAVIMPGKGEVSTTGKLGDVMIESARAALSYVRSRAELFGLRSGFHSEIDTHIHFPAGATPKDGPSAGIAITTALVSALLDIPARNDVAMTGEVTLRGRVLPIGGLREKLLAASRAAINVVIVPKENEKDLKEVPEEILKTLDIKLVEHVDEVLPLALASNIEEIFPEVHNCEPLSSSLRRHSVEITTAQ